MFSISPCINFISSLVFIVDKRPTAHIAAALLSLLLVSVPQILLAQNTDGENSTVVYPANYFSQWAPITAKDMLERIPGQDNSSPSSGGRGIPGGNPTSGGRGLGGGNSGGSEILINGKRTAGKNNQTSDLLTRISADQVKEFQIIRGTSGDLDVRGSGQVVNVVLFEELASSSTSYEANVSRAQDGNYVLGGTASISGQNGNLNYLFSASARPNYYNAINRENSRLGDYSINDRVIEERSHDQIHNELSMNLGYDFSSNSSFRVNALYAGVEDAALFRSSDGGENWSELAGLRGHSTGMQWQPGAGGMCLHTILLDKNFPERIYVAISAAGAFRSDDCGETWRTITNGLVSDYIPDPTGEIGHCVHRLGMHPSNPDVIFMQKHWDVMRSDDRGENWHEVSGNLPSDFGFPIAVHAHEPNTIYVIPIKSDSEHYPPEGKLRVYRSRGGGNEWGALTNGLPQNDCYVNVLRDAMAIDTLDECGIYFGTTGGQIYCSPDSGDNWTTVTANLPAVLSVEVQTIE